MAVKKSRTVKRSPWFTFKVTDEEKAEIRRRAAEVKKPVGVYVRQGSYRGWQRNTRATVGLVQLAGEHENFAQRLRSTYGQNADPFASEIEAHVAKLRALIATL